MGETLNAHYKQVAKAMVIDGRVVPLLGAGVNLCGRPPQDAWERGGRLLPSGGELAHYLAESFDYPEPERDLVRVSQYVSVVMGDAPLYEELHDVFAAEYDSTPLHRFLASLPAVARASNERPRDLYQLVVTTNYDDALEHAFDEAGEEYDLVAYIADGEDRGRFLHRAPGTDAVVIERPNEYGALSLERRPVILKVHGAVDRLDRDRDSFVITEDNYIDYLTRTDLSNVPVTLAAKLRESHILFLGYSLRDWNVRAIFHRVWQQRRRGYKSWAVQRAPEPMEQAFWLKRGVEIYDLDLEEYIAELERAVHTMPR
ncbi:MAG TPA: SIR2 family protein [Gaiellaceae bacterium]|nr:SIR2 family protein [Gaiellaceae bacterium]